MPAALKVWEKDWFRNKSGLRQFPSGLGDAPEVLVWIAEPRLVQRMVVPTEMVWSWSAKSTMSDWTGPEGVGVGEGVGVAVRVGVGEGVGVAVRVGVGV